MIHIFNRAELTLTSSIQQLEKVRDLLDADHIEYRVKSKTTLGSSATRDGRAGSIFGATPISGTQYAIYVRHQDLERAKHLIY